MALSISNLKNEPLFLLLTIYHEPLFLLLTIYHADRNKKDSNYKQKHSLKHYVQKGKIGNNLNVQK